MRAFAGGVGVVLFAFSAMFCVFTIGDIVAGGEDAGVAAGLLVFFAISGGAGAWLARRMFGGPPRDHHAEKIEREQAVLRLAAATDGRLTVAEVAARCGMTVEDGQATLRELAIQGVAESEIGEGGSLEYVFPGLEAPKALGSD